MFNHAAAFAVLAFGLSLPVAASAESIGTCAGADQVQTELKNSSSSGYYIPGLKLIIMNMTVLERYSLPVRKFIFAHECAHSDVSVGEDEAAADCAATKRGVREGWLGKPEIIQVCAHLARFPADATHAPIPVRCTAIRQCSGLFEPVTVRQEQTASTVDERSKESDQTPLTRLARSMD